MLLMYLRKLPASSALLAVLTTFFALFLLSETTLAQASTARKTTQKGLGHLKAWAGKLPRNPKSKTFRDFFALPEIKRPLIKMLDAKEFNQLVNQDFYKPETIELIGDYLVIMGRSDDGKTPVKHTQLAIGLKNGLFNIWHVEGKKMWGSSNSAATLPPKIEDKIMKFREN